MLSLSCNEQPAHDAGQQQEADSLEGQQVAVFVAAEHLLADGAEADFYRFQVGRGHELVLQGDEEHDNGSRDGGAQPGQELAPLQLDGLVALAAGEQDGEYVEHDDAPRIYHDLHGAQEGVSQEEVDAGRTEEYEQQIGGRTYHAGGGHRQQGEDGDEGRQKVEYDCF